MAPRLSRFASISVVPPPSTNRVEQAGVAERVDQVAVALRVLGRVAGVVAEHVALGRLAQRDALLEEADADASARSPSASRIGPSVAAEVIMKSGGRRP